MANVLSYTVSVINTATNTVITTIPAGFNPFGVAITPNGARVYVTNYGSNTVSVIDTAPNTVIATVPSGACPFAIAITPSAPTATPSVTVSGRVVSVSGRGIFRARLILTDSEGNIQTAYTNPFGYYRFREVTVGKTYTLTIRAKGYEFAPQVMTITGEIENLNFTVQ